MAAAAAPSSWQAPTRSRSRYRDVFFSRFFLHQPLLFSILLALFCTAVTSRQPLPSVHQPVDDSSDAANPPPSPTSLSDLSPLGRQAPLVDACTDMLVYNSIQTRRYFMESLHSSPRVTTASSARACLLSIPFVQSRDLLVIDTVIHGLDQFYIYKNIARSSPAGERKLPSSINIIKDLKEIRALAVNGTYTSVFTFYEHVRLAVQRLKDGHTHFDHCLSPLSYLALPVVGVVEDADSEIVVKVMPFNCELPPSLLGGPLPSPFPYSILPSFSFPH